MENILAVGFFFAVTSGSAILLCSLLNKLSVIGFLSNKEDVDSAILSILSMKNRMSLPVCITETLSLEFSFSLALALWYDLNYIQGQLRV